MKRIAFFFMVCFASTTLFAQTDTTELQPVEVRSIRAGATAPFTKTNISKPEIEKRNLGQDLPFLLNQTPSVVVNSDAGNGVGYTGLRIRGTDATRINVTLNGIPFNDAESQGVFFVDLPDFLSSVNSIQIQRGVGTSSNGSGAFGATINLSTNEVNKAAYAELNNSYGSFDTWKHTIKAGSGLVGNHFTTDVRLSQLRSSGYIDRATSNLKSLYFSTAYLGEKSNVRFNVITGNEKTYQAWYGVSEADLAANRTINYAGMEKPGAPYDNQIDNYTQTHYQLFFDHKFHQKLSFNTAVFLTRGKGYYEEYKAGEDYADYGLIPAGGETTTDLVRQRWLDNYFFGDVFSLQYQSPKTQLSLGGAATRYNGTHFGKVIWAEKGLSENSRYYDVDAYKNDFNVYGKWQQNLTGKWQWFTDLQWRNVRHHIDGFRENPGLFVDETYNFFNPKAGLSFHTPHLLAYVSYSIAHKEPNRDDFETNIRQLPRPEKLQDIELGVERKNTSASYGATLYYMRYKDQLVLTGKINDVGAYTRTNIDDSYRLGVELQGSAVFYPWLQASANLTLSRNRISNFTEYIDDYDDGSQKLHTYDETDISFSPDVTGSATITFIPVKPLEISFLSKYVGSQYLDNTQNENRKLNPFFTEDVRTIYSFEKGRLKKASIIAQVNNIFNKKYEPNGFTYSYYAGNNLITENYYYPMAGTNFMVALNIKL